MTVNQAEIIIVTIVNTASALVTLSVIGMDIYDHHYERWVNRKERQVRKAHTYTPTTAEIRDAYVYIDKDRSKLARKEFDRWLTEQVAGAWELGVADALGKPWLDIPDRNSGFHRFSPAHIGAVTAQQEERPA